METRTQQRTEAPHPGAEGDGQTLAQLIRELRDESVALLRDEVALAKTELSEKAARVARNGAYMATGAAVAYAGLVVLLLAAAAALYTGFFVAGISPIIAGWLSPLIVGGLAALAGYLLLQKGTKTLADESVVPERTVESIHEDKEWLERKVK
jgi:hypothetical protein